jgi:protein Tex
LPAAPPEPATPAVDKRAEAKAKLAEFAQKHNLNIIAIGNGTACRETEEVIAEVIASSLPELAYVIVSEAGASVYSVSPIAKDEFPTLDATVRSGASIGRRLQDPLSELVKIDPQSLGVGLYQHDMGRKELKEALEGVVESCVNQVGVDINTASVPLMRYVSGLNQMVAREIVEYRKNQGPFTSREQLLAVNGMGPGRYTQAAGFLKIPTGPNPLDRTWIHPESYGIAEKVMAELGYTPGVLDDKAAHPAFRAKLNEVDVEALARKLEVGLPTLDDIFHALAKPGRDPREELPPPIFKKGILKLEDLQAGMELKGTVLNVVDFGAFVDVGLKESGLVHISQMANKYIKSPYDVVSVNDIVTVWVLKIDKDANHVSLTMIKPGSDRAPAERGPRPPRREGERPPQDRGQRPPPRDRGPGGPPREGQGQRENQGGRPPQRRSGPPPRQGQGGPPRREERPAPPPPPPPPPRKPRREAPKPKLTQAAMEGKAPLRTLSELAAFFAAKEEKDKPAPPPPVEQKQEAPPPPTEQKPEVPLSESTGSEPGPS